MNKSLPVWFKTVAFLALIWNFMGIVNFISQILMSASELNELPYEEQQLISGTPLWINIAFAIAVFGGFGGSLLLLYRKKAAKLFLAASLVAALVQMNYWLFFTSVVDVYGGSAYAMPTVVILIAFALYRLSASGIKKGYLY